MSEYPDVSDCPGCGKVIYNPKSSDQMCMECRPVAHLREPLPHGFGVISDEGVNCVLRQQNEKDQIYLIPGKRFCVWDDCDKEPIYCLDHAVEYSEAKYSGFDVMREENQRLVKDLMTAPLHPCSCLDLFPGVQCHTCSWKARVGFDKMMEEWIDRRNAEQAEQEEREKVIFRISDILAADRLSCMGTGEVTTGYEVGIGWITRACAGCLECGRPGARPGARNADTEPTGAHSEEE